MNRALFVIGILTILIGLYVAYQVAKRSLVLLGLLLIVFGMYQTYQTRPR